MIYRRVTPGGGAADVNVDGTWDGKLSFASAETHWGVPATLEGFGDGLHTITLTVGIPNGASPAVGEVAIDSVSLPNTVSPTQAQQQALARVNMYRSMVGIPTLHLATSLDMSSQAHCSYYSTAHSPGFQPTNLDDFHSETPGTPGFTGITASDRSTYFGELSGGASEVAYAGISDPGSSVDGWMAAPYHRNILLIDQLQTMGFGATTSPPNLCSVIDLSYGFPYQLPVVRTVYTYPADGQQDVPSLWHNDETPDPVPGGPRTLGYPVSLYIAYAQYLNATTNKWQITTAEMHDASGQSVPTYTIDDSFSTFFLIAKSPLNPGASYTAHVAGIDAAGVPFDRTWNFHTATSDVPTALPSIEPQPTAPPAPTDIPQGLTTSIPDATSLPQPTATAQLTRHAKPRHTPVVMMLPVRAVLRGSTLMVQTAPNGAVSIRLTVLVPHYSRTPKHSNAYSGAGITLMGRAGRHGRYTKNLPLRWLPAGGMTHVLITITVRLGTRNGSMRLVTILHQPAPSRHGTIATPWSLIKISHVPRSIYSGDTLTLLLHSVAHAKTTAALRVVAKHTIMTGSGAHRRQSMRSVTLYLVTGHGITDGHGQFIWRLRVTYNPSKQMQASVSLSVSTPRGTITRTVTLLLLPKRHPIATTKYAALIS